MNRFDVIVVGAGSAGATAAYTAARAGLQVLLIERGPYAGSKNLTGGMLLVRSFARAFPESWQDAPLERPVQHQKIMMTSKEQTFAVEYSNRAFLEPPYNGFTVLRRTFDQWLVEKAVQAGAVLVTSTVVDDLLFEQERVVGVRVRREQGEIRANQVIIADGVNSLLAEKAGLRSKLSPHHVGLGVKELLALPAEVINERFGLAENVGAAYLSIGDFARGIPGGAFLYTNRDSLSLGLVAHPHALSQQKLDIGEVFERYKQKPEIARLIEGGKLLEYGGHLVPEAGYTALPKLYRSGLMVAGDAAGFVINTGIKLMGINLAIASGKCAAEAAVLAKSREDYSEATLKEYAALLEPDVLAPMRLHKRAAKLMSSPRLFNQYADMINNVMDQMVTDQGAEQGGLLRVARKEAAAIGLRQVASDALLGVRSL